MNNQKLMERMKQEKNEDTQKIIKNVLVKLDSEEQKLHERYVNVPMGKYNDRWNKIRWRINEVRVEKEALKKLSESLNGGSQSEVFLS